MSDASETRRLLLLRARLGADAQEAVLSFAGWYQHPDDGAWYDGEGGAWSPRGLAFDKALRDLTRAAPELAEAITQLLQQLKTT